MPFKVSNYSYYWASMPPTSDGGDGDGGGGDGGGGDGEGEPGGDGRCSQRSPAFDSPAKK